ncbi:uncharacterized protein LOC109597886 [Aethina tumida]|uniref:uncharacterized protein LOC109597886 n=1 Tax=Aethina tumida TaxID=116153 RepID=UPI002147C009|nr:uncharacterized protein LOC109597886 [Aethina tumida]
MYKTLAILALAIFAAVEARPKQGAAAPEINLDQLANSAKDSIDKLAASLNKNVDTKKIANTVNEQTAILTTNVQKAAAELNKKLNSAEAKAGIQQAQKLLTDATNTFKSQINDENVAKAKQVKEDLEKGIKDAVAEVQKSLKNLEPEAKAKGKEILDSILDFTKNLQNQLNQKAVEAKPKSGPNEIDIDQLANNAKDSIDKLTVSLNKNVDTKKIANTVNEQASILTTNVQKAATELNKRLNSPEAKASIQEAQKLLTDVTNSFKSQINDQNIAKVKQVKEDLEKGIKKAVSEVEQSLKNMEPEAKAKGKEILDSIIDFAKKLQADLK